MSYLQEKDYKNITRFFYRISNNTGDFRQTVLSAISEVFGYQRVTFWVADADDVLIDPRFHKVDKSIINSYAQQYYKYDPFDYKNLNRHLQKKIVLSLDDITDANKYYKENIYYQEVLRQYSYNQKLVVYLKDQNKFLGGMSFLRTKNEQPFNGRDKELLETLGKYIQFCFKKELALAASRQENQIFQDFVEISNTGIIILSHTLDIQYINATGKKYLADIYEQKAFNVEQLFKYVFYGDACITEDSILSSRHPIFMANINGLNIQGGVRNNKGKIQYFISIYPIQLQDSNPLMKEESDFIKSLSQHHKAKKLTPKELKISELILKGYTNEDIAKELFISISTVKTHIYNIFKKLEVSNRSSLIWELTKS